MATPRIPNSKKQYNLLNARLQVYLKRVQQLYDKYTTQAAYIASRTDYNPKGDKIFSFADYPHLNKAVEDMLNAYMEAVSANIIRGTSEEWKNSNEFQNLIANKALKTYGINTKSGEVRERYYQSNPDRLKAFQQRKDNGMNLSRRVWNLKEQYKQELELGLSVAIERGTSANELARNVKQYLNEPDKLFRRVRDKYGRLQLSKAAKAYHPGRGVYRSSFKNAQRLTRSEINMSYRTAEQVRWQQFDFVLGYEIKLSKSHPCEDVCDKLAGKYPKTFKWTGWHPNDLCYCIPILKSEDEFFSLNNEPSPNEITDVPEAFKEWVRDNKDRISTANERGTQPYFIRDNKDYIDDILKPREAKKTALQIAAERHAARTQEDIDRIQLLWNNKRLTDFYILSDRLGSYKDPAIRELALLLEEENSVKAFAAFKNDYTKAIAYLNNTITEQTALAYNFMQNAANTANMQQLAKALRVTQGKPMTFYEANVLRGNPNYAISEAYQVNCQTCVVAHELRRRGFNIEALANTKGSWSEKLSHMTNEIWRDANGQIPQKTTIGAEYNYFNGTTPSGRKFKRGWDKTVANRRQLIKELENSIIEDGRYHIDWYWNTQSKRYIKGHIITLEKSNGVIRYYDPQNGKVIDNFYDYINDIKLNRGINVLRVDSLRIDTDYASHILGKSGSKVVSSEIGKGGISGGITPKSDKAGFKALQKQTKSNAIGYSKEIKFDRNLFYTHRLVINKDALNNMVGHAYTADELKAIETLPNMLNKLINARYDPLKISRPNIRKKISSGAKHFVEYDIEINGMLYTLKTKAVKDNHGKFLIEHPYFFREKK